MKEVEFIKIDFEKLPKRCKKCKSLKNGRRCREWKKWQGWKPVDFCNNPSFVEIFKDKFRKIIEIIKS